MYSNYVRSGCLLYPDSTQKGNVYVPLQLQANFMLFSQQSAFLLFSRSFKQLECFKNT